MTDQTEQDEQVRDGFARQFSDKALAASLSRSTFFSRTAMKEIAAEAYAYADAMMAEREQRKDLAGGDGE